LPLSDDSTKTAAPGAGAIRFLLDHPLLALGAGLPLYHFRKELLGETSLPSMEAAPDFRSRRGYPKEYDMPIQLKTAEEFTKTAGGMAGKGAIEAMKALVKAMGTSLTVPKALGIGGGLAGIGLLSDILEPTIDTLGYRLQKATQPWQERIKLPDILAEAGAKGLGGGGADSLLGLASDIMQRMSGGISGGIASMQRPGILKGLMQDDPVLANAEAGELMKHYNTMAKFAPSLAMDENATRSFLRESIMSQAGPDYGTIAGLARAEKNVLEAQGM